MKFEKNMDAKSFLITLEPVTYNQLEADPYADLPFAQQETLNDALALASNHKPVVIGGRLCKKGHLKLS